MLMGPTASGKTALLTRLFARHDTAVSSAKGFFDAVEIVSADSAQVYRGMDIGTAKPDAALRAALPHHLIDIFEPDEQFNSGDFVRLANAAVEHISGRGGLAVMSGGTGFYINNFIYGLPEAPPSDEHIRVKLKTELAERGSAALMDELASCDSESAARIHINDSYRLLRALEVFRLTGKPLSSFQNFLTARREERKNTLIIVISREREELYKRINARCADMRGAGLKDEVQSLFEKGYTPKNSALRAIGYKEFFTLDENGCYKMLPSDYDVMIDKSIAQNSRNYAKRQITYFKSIKNANWIMLSENQNEFDKSVSKIKMLMDKFLSGVNNAV